MKTGNLPFVILTFFGTGVWTRSMPSTKPYVVVTVGEGPIHDAAAEVVTLKIDASVMVQVVISRHARITDECVVRAAGERDTNRSNEQAHRPNETKDQRPRALESVSHSQSPLTKFRGNQLRRVTRKYPICGSVFRSTDRNGAISAFCSSRINSEILSLGTTSASSAPPFHA